jgi:pyruvate/2-oxoglutarate dehydrogenase complex dihydrolipoamide acyltransferase (E2) component
MTSTEYVLPQLPFGGPEITIVRWLKRAGDRVSAGEPLLVVVNDRVELALPAANDGVFGGALASEGSVVTAGMPVATIAAQTAPGSAAPSQPAPPDPLEHIAAPALIVRISPVARRIAISAGIDLASLTGSGVSGRIVKADLLPLLDNQTFEAEQLRILPSPASQSPDLPVSQPPASSLQPHEDIYVLTAIEADMQRVIEAVAHLRPGYARRRLELNHNACIALAAVAALALHPLLNSAWQGDVVVARRRVHLTVVPSAGAPARLVHDSQDLNLRGLARALGGRPADAANGDQASTFSIVDLGALAWGDPSALARGRSAALGVGAVRLRPLVLDERGERLALHHAAVLTLAYDPRVLDQGHADAFLRDLKRRLEQFEL